ncbi:MAG: formylmethanofuran dehydrogenase subunit A [Candidatus Thorarchaeota archaeon]|jgi:formylmethanofuran dehydrogenase subunit A
MAGDIILKNGRVYDPKNKIDGEIMDVSISDGKIVDKVNGKAKEIDLKGRMVMAGGVDMHSHIVGSKLGFGRAMCPEDHRGDPVPKTKVTRGGVGYTMPNSYVIGYRYSAMGYTTVIEPALPALKGLGSWEELEDLPNLDSGLLPLFCNSMITFNYVKEKDLSGLAGYIAWILRNVGGLGVKVVCPGGTYAWAHGSNVRELDTEVPDWGITPREIIRGLCQATEALGLPHMMHLHPLNLGRVGNVATTIEHLDAIKDIKGHNGRKEICHLTHMSFESLAMHEDEKAKPEWKWVSSGGLQLAEYMNKNDHFTVDMGQITFGPATTMTGDGPFQFSLYQMTKNKWANICVDVEMPGGAGVVPYFFDPKSAANAVQWAIPLEFALSVDDVWRVIMTTDHPNAGPFTKYPLVLSWLMSKKQRAIWLEKVHKFATERSTLAEIEREWSLYEIAITTRAAPAKIMGLETKGHVGVGADADLTVYDFDPSKGNLADDPEKIIKVFGESYLTFLAGEQVAKKGKVGKTPHGRVWTVHPEIDDALWARTNKELEGMINRWYAHSFNNYPVPNRYREHMEHKIKIDSTDIPA